MRFSVMGSSLQDTGASTFMDARMGLLSVEGSFLASVEPFLELL
jgi:hypothetical protein